MKRAASLLVVCCLMVLLRPAVAAAQVFPGFDSQWSDSAEKVDDNHYRAVGAVELWKGDTRFYADKADYYVDTHRLIASGNVTMTQGQSTISASNIDFNTETRTGTFYGNPAWGMMSLGNRVDRSMFGTLEPDMMFYGDMIEKIGEKKYRITHGGFTTCVQPVPRWELTSGSVVISVDHYAVLTNSILRVKGVPLFYLPILYFPVKTKDDRTTGFLLPSYGTSTAQGFRLSNAFFWAINRSQDLTVLHDWFTKTGQGVGGDYGYVRAPGSQGNAQIYMLNQHELTTPSVDGTAITIPGKRSYKITASAADLINSHLRASGTVYYFSDLVTQQTYNLNIYDASRSQRSIRGTLIGSWGGYRITGAFDRSELFTGTTESTLTSAAPRINWSRSERPIGNLPVYVSLGGEYVSLEHASTTTTTGENPTTTATSQTVGRVDFAPTVRVPFTALPFLSVNSAIAWRGTFWTKSWDANQNLLAQSVSRRFFDFQSTITGPVVNRIFNTPNSGYAEKLKHTLEPSVTIDYTTAFPDFDRIVRWESVDQIVGGSTRVTYGITNRLYAKRKREGGAGASREILNVGITQTYYTNERASQVDPQYAQSFTGAPAFKFSPIALVSRVSATDQVNATLRAEWDTQFGFLRTVSAGSSYSLSSWLNTSASWTLTRALAADGTATVVGQGAPRPGAEPSSDLLLTAVRLRPLALVGSPGALSHFLNANANVRFAQNKYGGNYSFNYDVAKGQFVQQRITGYYHAQCCGFAVEYQTFNFGNLPGVLVPEDHRFNFSFTLAGIGSFSNFFGALGGAPR
jgi:lipopolysaccharide assembly outer membrane protein LptD (OstA)